jgi:Tol biopolymer transport system component
LIFIGTKTGEGYSTRRDQIYYLSYPQGEARRLTTDGNRYDVVSLGVTDRNEILAVPDSRSSQIWQMNPNGDARTAVQITHGLADGRAGLAPLADGRIGYVTRMGDNINVWLMNSDGSDQKQITYDPPVLEELRAAPDGRFFIFSTLRDGRNNLFVTDADGANLRQLTFGDNIIDSTVSPDGNWIVYPSYSSADGNGKYALWKISSSGGGPVLLTDKNCGTPHFSPDSKFVSCVSEGTKLAILSAEDGSIVKTFDPVSIPILNNGARWTPDGQALVYRVLQKNLVNLWVQPINGGAAHPLTNFKNGIIHNFAFSSDGTRLYVARGYPIRDAVLIKNFR